MIRKAASKIFILAAATLAMGAVAVNCSKKADNDDVGSVGLALTLPNGAMISTVHYTVTNSTNMQVASGDIDVSAAGTTQATALVSGLAPGSYTVAMTAMTNDGQSCMGSVTIPVAAGQTAMANIVLQCTRTHTTGSVAINGRIDQCPFLSGVASSSLQALVGNSITVSANAADGDGDAITYSWTMAGTGGTPGSGTFGAATAMTTFRCTTAGTVSISIAVSDGVCGDSLPGAIPLTCLANPMTGVGGTGGTGVGGTGGVAGTGGTGVGGTGGVAGTGGSVAGTGGGGTGGGGTSGGGNGGGGTGGVVACIETNPPAAIAAACQACLVANENPINDGCCPIMNSDSIGFTLCQAASACMRGCNVGGDITSCFCGTNPASCDQAGQANGPCVAQMTAAAGRNVVTMATDSPNAATVLARQGDPNFALGRASNIQVDAIGFCQVECGF